MKYENSVCVKCGRKLNNERNGKGEGLPYSKCIRCGLKYCVECWHPDFIEVCPRCLGSCPSR